jgi:ferredoxin
MATQGAPHQFLICSCDDTMPLDAQAVRRGCRCESVTTAHQLCGSQLDRFRMIAGQNLPLTVGCTFKKTELSEIAVEAGRTTPVVFANLRETAGWSSDAAVAGPKMAALLAAAAVPMPEVTPVPVESGGVILIYGRDESAIEAGRLLQDHLDVTVLIVPPAAIAPPSGADFPVVKGKIKTVTGSLGAFELIVDDFAQPAPSSRGTLTYGPSRSGAQSRCDIILDLSRGSPLFAAADLRDGYLRADPGNRSEMLEAVLKARDLTGTFEKPRFVSFDASLCAHSRSQIVGCSRCLDLCPAGAITPQGDHVAIDPHICAGCGQCAAVCPTGAASYALPPEDVLMQKLRAMVLTYSEAGGVNPVILFHDEAHGTPLIDALARFGDGLPANTLPFSVNEVTQVGLESLAAIFAYGGSSVRFLLREKPRHDISGLRRTIALVAPILAGLGFDSDRVSTFETDDPDVLGVMLREMPVLTATSRPASFRAIGDKRGVLRFALGELHRAALNPVDVIPLPAGAPFGMVNLAVDACTLCLSCVSACPTGALRDNADLPMLQFTEDACVQCGLCEATCPENAITLQPQLDFRAATAPPRILKQEEPFCCIRCSKPFGVRSTIDRVVAKLEGSHWMFKGAGRLDLVRMCEDCRIAVVSEENFDPYGGPDRVIRTTDDYLKEREEIAKRGPVS